MSEFEQKVNSLRNSGTTMLQNLERDFAPTSNETSILHLMGVEPNQSSIKKLNSGLSFRRDWKEKSSTWETKK